MNPGYFKPPPVPIPSNHQQSTINIHFQKNFPSSSFNKIKNHPPISNPQSPTTIHSKNPPNSLLFPSFPSPTSFLQNPKPKTQSNLTKTKQTKTNQRPKHNQPPHFSCPDNQKQNLRIRDLYFTYFQVTKLRFGDSSLSSIFFWPSRGEGRWRDGETFFFLKGRGGWNLL